jgi:CPA1 family monovalent cation:H+ antiporter
MPDIRLILALLAAVATVAAIGRRFGIPDPIAMALGGLALAMVPGLPAIALPPQLVLVVFLPPLIFAAAQDTSWAEIRRDALPILLLAVGLVLVTAGTVAVVAHALAPELTWPAAFALGAIVSPPDSVAAKAVATTLHLPRRLVAILSGEGLVNDATALLTFQVATSLAIAGTTFGLASAAQRFVYTAFASVAIGIAAGWIGRHILDRIGDPAVENTVMLLLPFGAFLPADAAHASGVVAVLSLALYLSRYSVVLASSVSRLQGPVLWEMIDFLLTGLSFVLVGLHLRLSARVLLAAGGHTLAVTAAVCATVILVRPAWVFAMGWLSHSVRSVFVERASLRPTTPILTVVSWAGMRGVISLAVALSLPQTTQSGQPFPGRDLIVFVAFVVILVTLVGQGLTLPLIVRRLGVEAVAGHAEDQELLARSRMARTALRALDARATEIRSSPSVVERVRGAYAGRLEHLEQLRATRTSSSAVQAESAQTHNAAQQLANALIDVERAELQRIQNDAIIDGAMTRRLRTELDLRRW